MNNKKVGDINEADKQEEATAIEDTKAIEEEAKPEEIRNEVVEEAPTNEETKEEQPKPKAKPKPSDRVDCNTCGKNLSYKNYRYRHEKLCTAEPKPVKPQAKPKAKVEMMPKPTFKTVDVYEVEEPKPIKKQTPQQPSNPLHDTTNHYQLLQNQYIQQKKENITIFVRICLPQNLKRDDDCFTIIIFNLLIKNDII